MNRLPAGILYFVALVILALIRFAGPYVQSWFNVPLYGALIVLLLTAAGSFLAICLAGNAVARE